MTNRKPLWSVVLLSFCVSPVLSQFVWTPPALIDTTTGNLYWQSAVSLAASDNGKLCAAWSDVLNTGEVYIILARSTDQGDTWMRSVPLGPNHALAVRDVKYDRAGNLWLLWSTSATEFAPFYLNLSKSTDNGQTFATTFTALEHGSPFFESKLAVDSMNSVYVLWDDQVLTLTRFRYGEDGQRFDAAIPSDTMSVGVNPSLVVDANYVYCLWEGFFSNNGLFAFVFCSVSIDTGQTIAFTSRIDTVDIPVPGGGASHWEPSGGVDSNGTLYVAYRKVLQTVSNWDVRVVKSNNTGQSFGSPTVLNNVGANAQPQLYVDESGGVSVVWSANDGLRFQRSADGGATYSNSQLIGAGRNRIAGDDVGNLFVAFDNQRVYFTKTNVVVKVPATPNISQAFGLYQNYPNPFNPSTIITYQLPANQYVTLKVYDLLGREAITLVNGSVIGGTHEVTLDGSSLSAGVYFCRLIAGEFSQTKKLLLIR